MLTLLRKVWFDLWQDKSRTLQVVLVEQFPLLCAIVVFGQRLVAEETLHGVYVTGLVVFRPVTPSLARMGADAADGCRHGVELDKSPPGFVAGLVEAETPARYRRRISDRRAGSSGVGIWRLERSDCPTPRLPTSLPTTLSRKAAAWGPSTW